MNSSQEPDIFILEGVIDKKYRVIRRLGKGGYGEIYVAKCIKDDKIVAVKVERLSRVGNLALEQSILQYLRDCGLECIPLLLGSGYHEGQIHYIVMNLLGENLSNVRRAQTASKFSQKTTCMLAMQMLKAIKEVHDHGYLHRDIKPGNFVLGLNNEHKIYLIDFGLSRRHLKPDGSVRAERQRVRWVGSRRYMSPYTHCRMDQGRRDDLWSFLYVVIEFYTGRLPWGHLKGINNLDLVMETKSRFLNELLTKNLPQAYTNVLNHILTLKYADRPNYQYIHSQFYDLLMQEGGHENFQYDWEENQVNIPSNHSSYDFSLNTIHSEALYNELSEAPENADNLNDKHQVYVHKLRLLEDSHSEDSLIRKANSKRELELKSKLDLNELRIRQLNEIQMEKAKNESNKKKTNCSIF